MTAEMLRAVVHCYWAAQTAEGGLKEAEQDFLKTVAQPYCGYKQECGYCVLKGNSESSFYSYGTAYHTGCEERHRLPCSATWVRAPALEY